MEDTANAAARLASLPLSPPLESLGKLCAVGRNALAEAICGNSTSGKDRWKNVERRDGCTLPTPTAIPERLPLQGRRQPVQLLAPEDVPAAIRKLLGRRESCTFLADAHTLQAVHELLRRCGVESPETYPSLKVAVQEAQTEQDTYEATLKSYQMPLLMDSMSASSSDIPTFAIRFLEDSDTHEVLIAVHDLLKWLELDNDGKHHDWHNWLRDVVEEYVKKGSNNLLTAGCCYSSSRPVLQYTRIAGERNPTPLINHCVTKRIITECGHRGKLSVDYAERAIDILHRVSVGDQRLHDELDRNAVFAPKQARAFVLGEPEALRQRDELAAQECTIIRRIEEQLPGVVSACLDRHLQRTSEEMQQRALVLVQQSLVQMQERLAESHIVHETTRNYGANARDQAYLKQHGRDPALEPRAYYEDDVPLEIASFVENKLRRDQHYVIVHFLGQFSAEVKRRRILDYENAGNRFWVTHKLSEYRLAYTEGDRMLMDAVWGAPETRQYLERQLASHRPVTQAQQSSRAADRPGRLRRRGPYARPAAGGSAQLSRESLAQFFGRRSAP
jgi:hypothetical protein